MFKELFQAPDEETGSVQQHASWMVTPAAWIRFHHEPRGTLYFLDSSGRDHAFWVDRDWPFSWTLITWTRRIEYMSTLGDMKACMKFNWTGITVFEIPLLPENVEPETTDLTARPPKPLSQPNEPSEQQGQVHNLTHVPFRSWCQHCVRGKAKEQQSVKSADRQPVNWQGFTRSWMPTAHCTDCNGCSGWTWYVNSCTPEG